MRTRPADAADENETAGQEGYSETFHTFTSMNKELERYIEREIIPRYEDFDAAHRTDHVRTVIAQSLELAAHYDADADMVYTVAAYHDTGLANGRERHHIDAGRILAADTELRRWFSEEQIAVMRDAVEDHRASSDGEPRTIYGRIVAEADRVHRPRNRSSAAPCSTGWRTVRNWTARSSIARCLAHLQQKYAEGGYLRLWIAESENARRLEELRGVIRDPQRLRKMFDAAFDTETAEVNPGRPAQHRARKPFAETAPHSALQNDPFPNQPASGPARKKIPDAFCRHPGFAFETTRSLLGIGGREIFHVLHALVEIALRGAVIHASAEFVDATRNPGGRPTRR